MEIDLPERSIMTKLEIMNHIIEDHNRILSVSVSGESAILIADTIRDLRNLVSVLQNDINAEKAKKITDERGE